MIKYGFEESDWYKEQEQIKSNLQELVRRNIGDAMDHLTDARKESEIRKLANSFARRGFYTEDEIRGINLEKITACWRGIYNSRFAYVVINRIQGTYDERADKEKRLQEIDKDIARLSEERNIILEYLKKS